MGIKHTHPSTIQYLNREGGYLDLELGEQGQAAWIEPWNPGDFWLSDIVFSLVWTSEVVKTTFVYWTSWYVMQYKKALEHLLQFLCHHAFTLKNYFWQCHPDPLNYWYFSPSPIGPPVLKQYKMFILCFKNTHILFERHEQSNQKVCSKCSELFLSRPLGMTSNLRFLVEAICPSTHQIKPENQLFPIISKNNTNLYLLILYDMFSWKWSQRWEKWLCTD